MLKPKVGDLVRLNPQYVVEVNCLDCWFRCYGGETFGFGEIEEILPRPLAVGDRVRHTTADVTGVVLGVDGEDAWVRTGLSKCIAVKAKNLRIDPA